MANYLVQGNKTVYCRHGHANVVPFLQTFITCPDCGSKFFVKFFGVVRNKDGSYIY